MWYPPVFGSHYGYLVYKSTQWQQEKKANFCYTAVVSFDKTFPLPVLLKEGYVWFRGRSLLLHGISGSQLRPILDRSDKSSGAGRLMLLLVYDCF